MFLILFFSFLSVMCMWQCKHCVAREIIRYKLLEHYKLHHHYGRSQHFLYIYVNCPCTFKTCSGFNTHVYKAHSSQVTQTTSSSVTFKCELCECSNMRTLHWEFFVHIGTHLQSNETVSCVFLGCPCKTNVYSTFYTNKNRKHRPLTERSQSQCSYIGSLFPSGWHNTYKTTMHPQALVCLLERRPWETREGIYGELDTLENCRLT